MFKIWIKCKEDCNYGLQTIAMTYPMQSANLLMCQTQQPGGVKKSLLEEATLWMGIQMILNPLHWLIANDPIIIHCTNSD